MNAGNQSDLWLKIERSLAGSQEGQGEQTEFVREVDEAAKRRRKHKRTVCDILGTVFWVYVFTKIFIGDLDARGAGAAVPRPAAYGLFTIEGVVEV
jgi:hypothetical protein